VASSYRRPHMINDHRAGASPAGSHAFDQP
jgi:hypothetical protein